jgi:hypothetical protein
MVQLDIDLSFHWTPHDTLHITLLRQELSRRQQTTTNNRTYSSSVGEALIKTAARCASRCDPSGAS